MSPEDRLRHRQFSLLAPGTRKGNPHWIARGRYAGRTVELSLGCATLEEARSIVDRMLDPTARRIDPQYVVAGPIMPGTPAPPWLRQLHAGARDRAAKAGLRMDLTLDELAYISRRAGGKCEVTHIPFSGRIFESNKHRRPFIPSLDRTAPDAGYTFDNCRLVLFAVNVALNDWGEDVLYEIALALVARHGHLPIQDLGEGRGK